MPLMLRTVAHSEVGLVRKNNQDSGYASPTMIVVADGMGGAAAGDLASTVAIAELRKADGHHDGEEMLETLAGALQRANDRIAELVADDHALDGMGTTVCGALFDGTHLGIVHIGDSRGYLRRSGTLQRLTHDHSFVQSLVDEGRISEAESLYHPHRSLLLKVLNGQPFSEPDLGLVEVEEGDRVLFCSDGLCGLVNDDVIDQALVIQDREQALNELIVAAHEGGGLDNITIIVTDVVSVGEAAAADQTPEDQTPEGNGKPAGAAGLLLGAAVNREIPAIRSRPIDIDGPVEDDDSETGNFVPRAPAPGVAPLVPASEVPEPAPPAPPRRRAKRRIGIWLAIVGVVLMLGVGSYAAYAYAATQYFLAPAAAQVGIYRGVPGAVAGFSTNQLVESTGVVITDLPPSFQQRVRAGIQVREGGLDAARGTGQELRLKSEQCIQQRKARAAVTAPPAPSPTLPAASPDPASPSVAGTPMPTPSSVPPSVPLSPDEC
ncbi:MAG: protein phosphatase 2C domain-containing protein [Actinomycetia bacterium]|nr:protein phosphatase 2C domain-containing protein [Actinomycetes bacterium]